MSTESRPRVFVSSVSENFSEYREAARRASESVDGQPILFEDFPSLPVSARTACLDGVQSCDVFVIIVGEKGGFTTPSGKLVVEEEWEEATRRKLPVLAFLEDTDRDDDARRLASALSDYSGGMFRATFKSPQELEQAVARALRPVISHARNTPVNTSAIDEKLRSLHPVPNQATLRIVITPEREDEVIDPVELDSPALKDEILALAHATSVRLMSYERPKSSEAQLNELVVLQANDRASWRDSVDEVRLEVSSQGMLAIDSNVTGRCAGRASSDTLGDSYTISELDVSDVVARALAFAKAFYDERDQWRRYDRLLYNVALGGIGHRKLVEGRHTGGSIQIGHLTGQHEGELVCAFPRPRLITRADLEHLAPQVQAVLTMLRRQLPT